MTWLISDLRFSQTEGRTTSYKGRFPKAEVHISPAHGRKRGFSRQGANRAAPPPPGNAGFRPDTTEARRARIEARANAPRARRSSILMRMRRARFAA